MKATTINDFKRYVSSQFENLHIADYEYDLDFLINETASLYRDILHDRGFRYGHYTEDYEIDEPVDLYELIDCYAKKGA